MKRGTFGWLAGVVLMTQGTVAALSPEQAAVVARLRLYDQLVHAQNVHALAALFAPDAEIQHETQTPTRGRAAIEALYASFADYQVLENSTTPESTVVQGLTATQKGRYHQRVKTPSGELVEASGRFQADWVKAAGVWLIKRLFTQSQ